MNLRRVIISILFTTLAVPISVSAQIEEIMVTAERRASTVQDTALSITAVDAEQLDQVGAFDAQSLADNIPNVNVSLQSNNIVITSRGIGTDDVSTIGDPAVALHLDGVYAPRLRAGTAAFYDIERIEFLRGPQGTLYGRNATAGSLNVIYNKPKNEFEAAIDVGYGNYDHINSRGMINIPVNDQLALRGAYFFDKHDGYTTLTGLGDIRDEDDFSARFSALYTPTENVSLLVAIDWHDETKNGVGLGLPAVNPFTRAPINPREYTTDRLPRQAIEDGGIRAELNIEFDKWTLTWAPAFRYEDQKLQTGEIDGTAINDTFLTQDDYSKQHTQELRATSTEPLFGWDWLLGFYYFREDQDGGVRATFDLAPMLPAAFVSEFVTGVESESLAVFANLEREINDQFSFIAGFRYTDDFKVLDNFNTFDSFGFSPFTMAPFVNPQFVAASVQRVDFTHFDWKVGVNWTPTENTLYYVHASTAYKAGKLNGLDGSAVDPEEILAVEVGAKTQFFDNTLQLNAAFFHNDYTDLQVSEVAIVGGTLGNLTRNVAEATTWGLELESVWLPVDGLRLEASLGFLQAEFDSYPRSVILGGGGPPFPIPGAPPFPPPVVGTVDLAGNELKHAPHWNFTLAGQYTWQLASLGSVTARVQTHAEADAHLDDFNNNTFFTESFTRTDVRVTYRSSDERFSVEAYGNNLENDDVLNFFAFLQQFTIVNYDPPRTYGLRAGYKW